METEEFIGRMLFFVVEGEGEVDCVDAQHLLEEATEGDAAAGAHIERLFFVEFQMDIAGGQIAGMVSRHEIGIGFVVAHLHIDLYTGGRVGKNVFGQQVGNLFRLLVGDQTAGDLGVGLAGQHRFGANTLEAAPDAVDFQRRPRPDAFQGAIAWFAIGIIHGDPRLKRLIIMGDSGDMRPVFAR